MEHCNGSAYTPETSAVHDAVTVVLTTSPTPSAPSTELVSGVLDSFRQHCPQLVDCPIIVVLDSYDGIDPIARLKKGRVTEETAREYESYKANIKQLIVDTHVIGQSSRDLHKQRDEAEYGNPCVPTNIIKCDVTSTVSGQVTFIEPSERLGFGLAVRSALRRVTTPYVWIQQHDWVLNATLPIGSLLDAMQASESDQEVPVKYICLSAPRMQSYATSDHVMKFPELKALTKSLKREFVSTSEPQDTICLTPMFFWHDKPHLASTKHYLERVFPTRLAVPLGAFIEDTVGHRARAQMKEGSWHRWATWLYYPDNGKLLGLRHLNGRTWRGRDSEASQKQLWIEKNARTAREKTQVMGHTGLWEDR